MIFKNCPETTEIKRACCDFFGALRVDQFRVFFEGKYLPAPSCLPVLVPITFVGGKNPFPPSPRSISAFSTGD